MQQARLKPCPAWLRLGVDAASPFTCQLEESEMRIRSVLLNQPISACTALAAACLWSTLALAQSGGQAVTLDPPTGWELQVQNFDSHGKQLNAAPANFRRFGEAHAGVAADLHTLTLRFAETTKLTEISSTPDFTRSSRA